MNDDLLHDVADQLRHRFYGKYRGVVDETDPKTMRVKATVPAVLGESSTWCDACVPYAGTDVGFCFLPEPGSGVWIEFEAGDVEYPIWSGCFWFSGEVPSDADKAVRVIVTKAGHKVIFDDDAGEIRIEDANGGSIVFDSSGVTIARASSSVAVGSTSVSVNDGAMEVT